MNESKKTPVSLLRKLGMLRNMGLPALRTKYRELFGFETTCGKADFLRKRIAFRMQELYFGTLTDEEDEKLTGFINDDPVIHGLETKKKKKNGKPILHGTRLVRIWEGQRHEVAVCDDGLFEYNGKYYRSLSSIANEITGKHWNGKLFFKVK